MQDRERHRERARRSPPHRIATGARLHRRADPHAVKRYLLSLPERLVRSTLGLGAGAAREVGEVVLPDAVRGSQLYRNLVDTTLRFVIEQVGGVEGVYTKDDGAVPDRKSTRLNYSHSQISYAVFCL